MLNSSSRDAGLYILNSFKANGSKMSRRTLVPATVHPKEKSQTSEFQIPASRFQIPASRFRVPGSRFQIPDSRFWILGCSPYKEISKATGLYIFPREDTTAGKQGANELSVNPRGNTHQQIPSTCTWQRRFKTRRRVIE
ncbi:hypothetical protein Bca4012_072468 [Brassica carinata]